MKKPYIGICDFTDNEQVRKIATVLSKTNPRTERQLMAGIMVSYKTLNGMESSWTKCWPPKEDIPTIFLAWPSVMNCIHYADPEQNHLLRSILKVDHIGGWKLNTIQLDLKWPNPEDIKAFRLAHPQTKIVLQANADALSEPVEQVVQKIKLYEDSIDYILLDKSMGTGQGLDADFLAPYIETISKIFHDIGIAIAGGLGPDSLELAEPLIKKFKNLSIDAQSRLRISGDAHDPINWERAEEYIRKAVKMFNRHEGS